MLDNLRTCDNVLANLLPTSERLQRDDLHQPDARYFNTLAYLLLARASIAGSGYGGVTRPKIFATSVEHLPTGRCLAFTQA
jgi:hypothetical protein